MCREIIQLMIKILQYLLLTLWCWRFKCFVFWPCTRFYKSDFKTKTKDKVGYDWPIDLKDLEKFYDLNEKKLGVRGLIGNKNYPNIKKLKPHILLLPGEKVAEGFNKLVGIGGLHIVSKQKLRLKTIFY